MNSIVFELKLLISMVHFSKLYLTIVPSFVGSVINVFTRVFFLLILGMRDNKIGSTQPLDSDLSPLK